MLVKTKVKVDTFSLNYLVGWSDKYGLTREPDNILLISLLIYFVRMTCSRVSESNLVCVTYKVVYLEGMDVGF